VDVDQRFEVLGLLLLFFTLFGFNGLSDEVGEEDHQLLLQVLLADLTKLFSDDFNRTVAGGLTLLLVLRRLLLLTSTVISSALRVSGVFVVIRLLLILSSGVIILRLAALITSTSVILVPSLRLVGSLELIKLRLLDLGLGLNLNFFVFLPALRFIIKHVPDQKLKSLADFKVTFVFFH
jgi:hypothetical protein